MYVPEAGKLQSLYVDNRRLLLLLLLGIADDATIHTTEVYIINNRKICSSKQKDFLNSWEGPFILFYPLG